MKFESVMGAIQNFMKVTPFIDSYVQAISARQLKDFKVLGLKHDYFIVLHLLLELRQHRQNPFN